MPAVAQELVALVLVGGVVSFYLFVIISSRMKKRQDKDKKNGQ
jgi:hypothetical protein